MTVTLVRPAAGGLGLTLGVKYPGNNVRIACVGFLEQFDEHLSIATLSILGQECYSIARSTALTAMRLVSVGAEDKCVRSSSRADK